MSQWPTNGTGQLPSLRSSFTTHERDIEKRMRDNLSAAAGRVRSVRRTETLRTYWHSASPWSDSVCISSRHKLVVIHRLSGDEIRWANLKAHSICVRTHTFKRYKLIETIKHLEFRRRRRRRREKMIVCINTFIVYLRGSRKKRSQTKSAAQLRSERGNLTRAP